MRTLTVEYTVMVAHKATTEIHVPGDADLSEQARYAHAAASQDAVNTHPDKAGYGQLAVRDVTFTVKNDD